MPINKLNLEYNKYYKSIGFERIGLFQLLKLELNPKTILYPGSSIHITPSFYFDHVVYIDKSDFSAAFFKHKSQVLELIDQYKAYQQKTFIKYINSDFANITELRKRSYDVLLSIFSGTLINHFEKYVKYNGLILTTNLFSDNESIINYDNYKLVGIIKCKNGNYSFSQDINFNKLKKSKLISTNANFNYIDNEIYYFYRNLKK